MTRSYDVAVIGAGFGGLGAALGLAERGAKVVLCEALNYPGGCASTFSRQGHRFEAGATLFSGFGEGQLFARIIARHRLDVQVDFLDPLVTLRTPSFRLAVPSSRERFVEELAHLAGERGEAVRAFFAEQRRVADALWSLFDDPSLLPPFDAGSLLRHMGRVPRYLPLLGLIGRPLGALIDRHGLRDVGPLLQFLRGACQITVQADADEAEAPFALAAMDYYFRGTGHVRHGIGALAAGMLQAIVASGGDVHLATRVRGLARRDGGYELDTRRGTLRARQVVANLLPQDLVELAQLAPGQAPGLERLATRVRDGWGAVMLYRVLRAEDGVTAHHLELIRDEAASLSDGNHVFVSASGALDERRAPEGMRTLTASTHVRLSRLRALSASERATEIGRIQQAMRETIAALAPEVQQATVHELTASPRTFERFTLRSEGLVGGIPRTAGLANYRELGPFEALPGLFLVGDSVFPGQSTLATALGGERTAELIARRGGG